MMGQMSKMDILQRRGDIDMSFNKILRPDMSKLAEMIFENKDRLGTNDWAIHIDRGGLFTLRHIDEGIREEDVEVVNFFELGNLHTGDCKSVGATLGLIQGHLEVWFEAATGHFEEYFGIVVEVSK